MNKFKNASGAFLLQALFYEEVLADKSQVLYTLKDYDHAGYPSLYRLYMECDDPTEYTFAVQCLDGWAHWERLCDCPWFKSYRARWQRELEVRTRSRALKGIISAATSTSKDAHAAQKILLNGGWKTETKRKAGAPSKEEIIQATKQELEDQRSLLEDYERIRPN